jgi:hypothetical protein
LLLAVGSILIGGMKRQGFLDDASRRDLIELAQDGSAAHRLARRANALVLLVGVDGPTASNVPI